MGVSTFGGVIGEPKPKNHLRKELEIEKEMSCFELANTKRVRWKCHNSIRTGKGTGEMDKKH